ncbi:MAG: PAS domain-containing protein [Candidatus Melainabacteria bacterium]|nr:PAS domain-containing protein [Candidatus Melainabacteria bacterium]
MNTLNDTSSALDSHQLLLTRMSGLIPKMVWLSEVNGKRFFFSGKWLEFTGRASESPDRMNWLESVHEMDRPNAIYQLNEAYSGRNPFHIQYRLRRRDGTYREFLDSGTPQFRKDGAFCGYMGVCSDLEESGRSGIEWKTLEPEKASKSISTNNNSPIAMWKLDSDFRIVKANPAVYGQLGDHYSDSDVIGQRFTDIVQSISETSLQKVLQGKTRLNDICHKVVLSSQRIGIQPVWQINAWRLQDETGRAIGIGLSTIEVETNHTGTESLEEFVAALVHDLKTPLIGADKTLEAILAGAAGNLDEGQSQILEVLQKSNRSMLSMVQNLIEVQRQEAGKSQYFMQPTKVFQLVRTTMMELSALACDRGLELIYQLPDSHLEIPLDQMSMKRVFLNVIGNALKFTNRGGQVTVSGAIGQNEISITVTDTGIGIPEVDIPRLFMRYFQGSRGRRSTDGFGLGLYLCKTIVETHCGHIQVTSKESEGSSFTVTLPMASGPHTTHPSA